MRRIYLVRHASPDVRADIDPRAWQLSGHGMQEARAVAALAAPWRPRAVYCSTEAKARATASVIAEATGLAPQPLAGLDELRIDRWIADAAEFADLVRRILTSPEKRVADAERASGAAARFEQALAIVAQQPMPAIVVSHGRVMAAYLATVVGSGRAFDIWRTMPAAGWAQLDLSGGRPVFAHDFCAPSAADVP